jgi:hypothetical protein
MYTVYVNNHKMPQALTSAFYVFYENTIVYVTSSEKD